METNYSSEKNEKKWYDNTWVVVLLCIFFFPVGLYALWKNSTIKKGWKITVTVLIGLIVIAQFGENTETSTNNSATADSTEIGTEKPALSKTDSLKQQLEREIASFKKPFDNSTYKNSVEGLQMEVVLFSVWATIINEGESSTDKTVNELAADLKKKVVALQIKEFPQMRKNYGKVAADKLWENDIYVSTQGAKHETMNLTSGIFASNKGIAETQRTLIDVMTQFRFKEVRYRWYKGADEFTYYKVESPKDNEIAELNK